MTRRGFWFLSACAGAVAVSLAAPPQYSLTLFGLTGLVWCGIEWLWLQIRCEFAARRLTVTREVDGQPVDRAVLWEGRPVRVVVRLAPSGRLSLPWMRAIDLRPTSADARGAWFAEGPCRAKSPLEIAYDAAPKLPGRIVFDGVMLELTDGPGFFSERVCLRERAAVKVLPSLTPEEGTTAIHKRRNRIPTHGVHRHLRQGSGSELLNLRDYVVGDPPKRIAWKVSARRDKLITKEYESEVPVRTWLFLDASDGVRVGWPGPTPLDQSIRIASALTRELIAQRDPVGLALIDDDGRTILPPAPGPRQQTRILGELCRTAGRPPKPSACPPDLLYAAAERLCRSRYPELMDAKVNRRMWRVEWPLRRLAGWPLSSGLGLAAAGLAVDYATTGLAGPYGGLAAAAFAALLLAWLPLRLRVWRSGSAVRGSTIRMRKRIASVVAAVRNLGPYGLARMIESDEAFSVEVQRFLIDHQAAYPRPLHDARGRYLFQSPAKLDWAAQALLRALAHGRDNEVFVLLLDLLEHEGRWDPLIDAVKTAKSRHHQVIMVCPWPAELMAPAGFADRGPADRREGRSAPKAAPMPNREAIEMQVERILSERYFQAFDSAWGRLAQAGIPLLTASVRDTPQEVLRRIEAVRSARIRAHR
jgi:uncharacterized protein (DUF58 family)